MNRFSEYYLKKMKESKTYSEAKNYAKACGYDIKKLIVERYLKMQ